MISRAVDLASVEGRALAMRAQGAPIVQYRGLEYKLMPPDHNAPLATLLGQTRRGWVNLLEGIPLAELWSPFQRIPGTRGCEGGIR